MNAIEKKQGRKRIYLLIFTTILVLGSYKLYHANKDAKLQVKSDDTVLTHTETVLAESAPEVVPEPIPEPIVQPVAPEVPTINQAQAGVTYSPNDCEQYRPILSKYNWDVNVAMAIMKAESGCRYEAFNPEWHRGCQGSLGLFQIACLHQGSSFDPETNIATAYRIYSGSGWRPWGAFTNGSYTRYL